MGRTKQRLKKFYTDARDSETGRFVRKRSKAIGGVAAGTLAAAGTAYAVNNRRKRSKAPLSESTELVVYNGNAWPVEYESMRRGSKAVGRRMSKFAVDHKKKLIAAGVVAGAAGGAIGGTVMVRNRVLNDPEKAMTLSPRMADMMYESLTGNEHKDADAAIAGDESALHRLRHDLRALALKHQMRKKTFSADMYAGHGRIGRFANAHKKKLLAAGTVAGTAGLWNLGMWSIRNELIKDPDSALRMSPESATGAWFIFTGKPHPLSRSSKTNMDDHETLLRDLRALALQKRAEKMAARDATPPWRGYHANGHYDGDGIFDWFRGSKADATTTAKDFAKRHSNAAMSRMPKSKAGKAALGTAAAAAAAAGAYQLYKRRKAASSDSEALDSEADNAAPSDEEPPSADEAHDFRSMTPQELVAFMRANDIPVKPVTDATKSTVVSMLEERYSGHMTPMEEAMMKRRRKANAFRDACGPDEVFHDGVCRNRDQLLRAAARLSKQPANSIGISGADDAYAAVRRRELGTVVDAAGRLPDDDGFYDANLHYAAHLDALGMARTAAMSPAGQAAISMARKRAGL